MNKTPLLIITVFISGLILFAFVPGLISATVETETLANEGGGWARFKYVDGSATYDIKITATSDSVAIRGGTTQTGPLMDNTILYADSNLCVYLYGGVPYLAGADWRDLGGESWHYYGTDIQGGEIEVKRNSSGVRIVDNDDNVYSFEAPAWAYVPIKNGPFAFYPNGSEVIRNDPAPLASVGTLAGVGAYNGAVSVPNLLTLNADVGDDYISGVQWDHINTRTLRGATEGDFTTADGWGYDLDGNNAIIVNYARENMEETVDYNGACIEIPAEVDGHPVKVVGGGNVPIFDINMLNYTFSIPDGVLSIGAYAFADNWTVKGVITIPASVQSIGYYAFYQCGISGVIVMGDTVPNADAFNTSPIYGVLNFGSYDWAGTVTSWYEAPMFYPDYLTRVIPVSDHIDAIGYIGAVSYTDVHYNMGSPAVLIRLIPLMFLIGLAVFFINKVNNRSETEIRGGWKK